MINPDFFDGSCNWNKPSSQCYRKEDVIGEYLQLVVIVKQTWLGNIISWLTMCLKSTNLDTYLFIKNEKKEKISPSLQIHCDVDMEEILNTKFTLRFPSRNILIYNLCYGRNMSKLVPGLVYDFLHFISVWCRNILMTSLILFLFWWVILVMSILVLSRTYFTF
jgi:hypothetical protein